MKTLVTVDPGKHFAGVAMFTGGKLDACGLVGSAPPDQKLNRFVLPHPLLEIINVSKMAGRKTAVDKMVVEIPQIYQQRKWKGDPNDCIDITLTAGAIIACFGLVGELQTIQPGAWKGQVPKKIMLNRIAAAMEQFELDILSESKVEEGLKHNVLDAIGIGLWSLGRLNKKKGRKNEP